MTKPKELSRRPVKDLQEASEWEGTEHGEYWEMLLTLARKSDFVSDELKEALEKEIKAEEEWAKENFELVEYEFQYTNINVRTDLEYIGE